MVHRYGDSATKCTPVRGVRVVTGAANSSETITAVDSINITIDIDADGNGTVDQTINTTWGAL